METIDTTKAVSVNYHGLPEYLRKEAIAMARQELNLGLKDLMLGRAEFGLSHRHPETDRRNLTDVTRTTIA
ncbi:MAG: hypothetical protein KIT10_14475 [Flavobacteriales bacterium]|nr:hypothetical protein [Flavobacteriales bacterium]